MAPKKDGNKKPGGKANKGGPAAKKLSAEEQARLAALGVTDISEDQYKLQLRETARALKENVDNEEKLAAVYQQERERINYFWIVEKKKLEDRQADLRNKERELQDLVEKHEIETKVYQQRVKHLLFQNQDHLTMLKKEAQLELKNLEDQFRIDERALKYDVRSLKIQEKEVELNKEEFLRALRREQDKQITNLRQEYERRATDLKNKYHEKMQNLIKQMDLERKAQIERIENRKIQEIKKLIEEHQKKFEQVKNYYTQITNTNIELIKGYKDEVLDKRAEENKLQKELNQLEKQNKSYTDPLKQTQEQKKELELKWIKYQEDQKDLHETKDRIQAREKEIRQFEWEYEVLLQKFQYVEREKTAMKEKLETLLHEINQKSGLKNLILEKKIETIQENIETKEVQLSQILTVARVDPRVVSTLEEIEARKNQEIQIFQAELQRIREAHSNMVKTYESKLSEFGIPVEELGFDPLVPANT